MDIEKIEFHSHKRYDIKRKFYSLLKTKDKKQDLIGQLSEKDYFSLSILLRELKKSNFSDFRIVLSTAFCPCWHPGVKITRQS